MPNNNLIEVWFNENLKRLQDLGFSADLSSTQSEGMATVVRISSDRIIGAICYWPPTTVEFDFSGLHEESEVFLHTAHINSQDSLDTAFWDLIHQIQKSERSILNLGAGDIP